MAALLTTTQPIIVAGVDAHKDTHHAVVLDGNGVRLADRKFPATLAGYLPALAPLIGGTINTTTIGLHWDEILRLATSIKTGTVTASLMMRKLGAYPRQNGLAAALRELGTMERTSSCWTGSRIPACAAR